MNIKSYIVEPSIFDLEHIVEVLSTQFSSFVLEPSHIETRNYFDTFDLRLLKNNIIFSNYQKQYFVEWVDGERQEIAKETAFRSHKRIKTKDDLPECLQENLGSILDVRALLPIMSLKEEATKVLFLNDDKKTVLRVKFETILLQNEEEPTFSVNIISLIPLRGYEKKLLKSEELLLKTISCNIAEKKKIVLNFIEKSGKVPVAYTQKPLINISSEMDSYSAIKRILKVLYNTAVINECGVINDDDSEFLHDFRVAFRKTRSILGQLKNVFNINELEVFIKELSGIASRTNQLRDMDVYLINKKIYCQMLPGHLHQELEVFFKDVRKKKRREHRQVASMLKSSDYRDAMDRWGAFLNSTDESLKGAEAEIPVVELAKKYIYRRYTKIVKQGSQVKENSHDDEFHKVRISCKKLRYLLELLSGLFPEDKINAVIKQLKNIQDSLGNFNDMSVQEEHLDDYLHTLSGRKTDSAKIAAAIGGLIISSYNRKIEYRIEFLQKFNRFTSKENLSLFEKLFKGRKQP